MKHRKFVLNVCMFYCLFYHKECPESPCWWGIFLCMTLKKPKYFMLLGPVMH